MALIDLDRRVLALAVARMVDAIGNSFLIVVLPAFIASGRVGGGTFGLTQALVIGVVLSVFGLLNSLSQPFTGRLSDRVGKRKVFILFGLGLLAVTNVAYAFVDTYAALVGIRLLQGLAVAFTIPCTIALVNEIATTATRGGNMGLFNTFRLAGFGAGPLLAGVIVERGPYALPTQGALGAVTAAVPFVTDGSIGGFDAAFAVAGATAVAGFVLVELMVEDAEETKPMSGGSVGIAVLSDEEHRLFDPVFVMGVVSLFVAVGVALFATLQPQVNGRLDQGPTAFSMQFSAFVLAQILLQIPVGNAADVYGRKRFIVLGLALFVPFTALQGVAATPMQMFMLRLAQGIAGALVFAPALALAGDLAREGESGSTLSVLTMSFGLGTAVGPLVSGYTIRFGFAAPFLVGAVLALVGTVLVVTEVDETLEESGGESTVAATD